MRRRWKVALAFLVVVVALVLYAAWPGRSTFTVSPETTYVTGPLDKHGYVDYVTALNERLRGDIKPEENANVLTWQALGPRPEGGDPMPAEYFQLLGIDSLPEDGEYFVSWPRSLKENPELLERIRENPGSDPSSWTTHWPWSAEGEPEFAEYLRK